MVTTTPIGGQ